MNPNEHAGEQGLAQAPATRRRPTRTSLPLRLQTAARWAGPRDLLPARATTARERSRSSFERTPGVEGAAVVDEPDTYHLATAARVPVDHAPGSMRGHLEVRDQRAPMFDGDSGGDG